MGRFATAALVAGGMLAGMVTAVQGATLYATSANDLFTIDPITGASTLAAANVFPDQFNGLAFSPTVVPLPATFPLLAGGLALLGLFGWRCKRVTAA